MLGSNFQSFQLNKNMLVFHMNVYATILHIKTAYSYTPMQALNSLI